MHLVHLQKALHLLINRFHNVLRNILPLEVLQELLDQLLFFIGLLVEVRLKRLVYLRVLLLCFLLILSEIVLLFKIRPNRHFIHKIAK